jgi:transposase
LKRDFQSLIDKGDGQAKRLVYDLRRATCKLFEHWASFCDGKISRAALQRRMAPVRREVEHLLLRGLRSGNTSLVGMCQELHEHGSWLWMFVYHDGVEPTNNAGERALRHAGTGTRFASGFGTRSAISE